MLYSGFHDGLGRNVLAKVYDREAVAVKEHLDDVLAYIVYISVDSGEHHLALGDALAVCRRELCLYDLEARLRRLGGEYELGQEYLAFLEFSACTVKGRDKIAVDYLHGVNGVHESLRRLYSVVFQSVFHRVHKVGGVLVLCRCRSLGSAVVLCVDAYEIRGIAVNSRKEPVCSYCADYALNIRIDDGQVQTAVESHCEECTGDELTVWQSEGYI